MSTSNNGRIVFTIAILFRYLLAATIIGLAYTFLQIALTIFLVSTGNRIGGDGMLRFDFYGDKVIAYVLATGAAASFGMTQDLKSLLDQSDSGLDKFLSMADAATSLSSRILVHSYIIYFLIFLSS